MSARTLVGLYFVCDLYGPTSGIVTGHPNHETISVRVMSEREELIRFVPVSVAMEWDFYKSESEALRGFGRACKEAFCH